MWDLTSPQGIEPKPPALEGKVLTTGPPGKSLDISFSSKCLSKYMGFSRQEYWSELSFPSPGDLPDPGNEAGSSALQADSLPAELREVPHIHTQLIILPSPLAHGR